MWSHLNRCSIAFHPLPLPPLQLYEVQFDRTGQFTGVKMGMSLKGHKSKVFCIDFSPDLTKASALECCLTFFCRAQCALPRLFARPHQASACLFVALSCPLRLFELLYGLSRPEQ